MNPNVTVSREFDNKLDFVNMKFYEMEDFDYHFSFSNF